MKSVIIIFLSLFLFSCSSIDHQSPMELSPNEKAVNSLLCRIAQSFKKKYNLQGAGTNVAMFGGVVRLLGLDFQLQGPLPQETIRKILILLAQDFLLFVNSDERIKPYLKNYPFEVEDISITLFFDGPKHSSLYDPLIAIADISSGKLCYKTLVKYDGVPNIKTSYTESYEEALEKLND